MIALYENDLIYNIPLADFFNKKSLLKSSFIFGNNDASLVIFFESENNKLDETKLAFLSKMLAAVDVNINDVLMINNKINLSIVNLIRIIDVSTIFLFDINPKNVGVINQIDLYSINKYNNVKYIFCEDLHIIEQSVSSKKAIWAVLKEVFKL